MHSSQSDNKNKNTPKFNISCQSFTKSFKDIDIFSIFRIRNIM